MSSEPAIRGVGLSKSYRVYRRPKDRLRQMLRLGSGPFYREFHALSGIDIEVGRGETLGIVGRNGSGKSTLLKVVCGLLARSGGELEIHGNVAPILTLGAGFSLDFTGRENAILNATILGLSDASIRSRIDAIESFADIGEFFDQPVKSYSTGMYSRLAFAVAINADPDILVVDEVLAVGDDAFTRKCSSRIQEIKAGGATILLVSHSAPLVLQLCDRVMLLERGEALATGDPKRVLAAPPTDGFYVPALVPKSTVEYEIRGARIREPRILGSNGLPVNLLEVGRRYTYAYEVDFSEPAFQVRFGMMIKLMSGLELAGQTSHAEGDGIEQIAAGQRARVRFHFSTALSRGTYFLNAGVLGTREGEEVFLHRVVDGSMFRIESRPAHATGYVDLSNDEPPEVTLEDA
jgi:lipopolysaccharide transport system ATP-binding protein